MAERFEQRMVKWVLSTVNGVRLYYARAMSIEASRPCAKGDETNIDFATFACCSSISIFLVRVLVSRSPLVSTAEAKWVLHPFGFCSGAR